MPARRLEAAGLSTEVDIKIAAPPSSCAKPVCDEFCAASACNDFPSPQRTVEQCADCDQGSICNPRAEGYGEDHRDFRNGLPADVVESGKAYGYVVGQACAWAPIVGLLCSEDCVDRNRAAPSWPCGARSEVRPLVSYSPAR